MAPASRFVIAFRAVAGLLAAAAGCAAWAANVMIEVADADGKLLPDAAALLEPIGPKAPVKPLADVPPGNYRLRVWHPLLGINVEPATSALSVDVIDLTRAVRLPVSVQP